MKGVTCVPRRCVRGGGPSRRDVTRRSGLRGARPRVWCTCAAERWPRLKVTLRPPAPLCFCVARGIKLRSFHLSKPSVPVFASTRISACLCARWNLWRHPVDSNAPRSSRLVSVATADKTNRYASTARHREYEQTQIFALIRTFPTRYTASRLCRYSMIFDTHIIWSCLLRIELTLLQRFDLILRLRSCQRMRSSNLSTLTKAIRKSIFPNQQNAHLSCNL